MARLMQTASSFDGELRHVVLERPGAARELGKTAFAFAESPVLVEIPDMPAFANNNRGNAYRIYLELEQSQFKADKP